MKRAFFDDSVQSERKKKVAIIFEDSCERFTIEKRVAIPILEALRTYRRMKEMPENISSDISKTANILLTLSDINF